VGELRRDKLGFTAQMIAEEKGEEAAAAILTQAVRKKNGL
jgi:hypothetical protein